MATAGNDRGVYMARIQLRSLRPGRSCSRSISGLARAIQARLFEHARIGYIAAPDVDGRDSIPSSGYSAARVGSCARRLVAERRLAVGFPVRVVQQ